MRRFGVCGLALAVVFVAVPAGAVRARQAAPAPAVAVSPAFEEGRRGAERITPERLKEILYLIASDEMAGRDTPSQGLDATAQYIADRLKKLKVKPAGDRGSYFQRITLRSTQVDREKTQAALGGQVFKFGQDFLAAGRTSGEAEGQVVYAGHGWVVKSKNINAYEGLDVRGRIVVVSGDGSGLPPGLTLAELRKLPGGDWETPVSYARRHGAKALVLIPRNFQRRWLYGAFSAGRAAFRVVRPAKVPGAEEEGDEDDEGEPPADEGHDLPAVIPSFSMLNALFAGEEADGARVLRASTGGEPVKGFALNASKRLRLSVQLTEREATTQNVVGVLEGRDPKLRREYVALGAHYDHVGVGRPDQGGDTIYNGADDDGSGTTAMLAMAEAWSKGRRPKRSILFVWHTAEEKGLWGSQHFTDYPTVPLAQVVVQLNMDMIGRSKQPGDAKPANKMLTGPDEIYVIGSRMMSTELGELTDAVNRAYLNLNFNFHYDKPGDPEQLFSRSDHYNYARKGIPIVFFFNGVHEDYHKPSDSPDKIDYEKMTKVTRTVFVLASELANAPRRPAIDRPLHSATTER
ncbi:MAG TPA: M20/M25/M40 family metallo-hydrolase [Pyrinomonadaceae bacterium]|nr:M20/M25/M40 family metallo-hydrolase [Pyrinomonadaceae bacterium]